MRHTTTNQVTIRENADHDEDAIGGTNIGGEVYGSSPPSKRLGTSST